MIGQRGTAGNMLEVEIKLKLESIEDMENRLKDSGYTRSEHILETDVYVDTPSDNIRISGKACRVRTIKDLDSGDSCSYLTFKGEKTDTISMTRAEYETQIDSSDTGLAILRELGFYPVKPCVVKERILYTKGKLNACLDRVKDLEDYLELEIISDADDKDSALDEIWNELSALGYSKENVVNTSYLSMLQGRTDAD